MIDFHEIKPPFYRVSLKIFVFDDQSRLLMCRSPDGEWEPPGGGWEDGESIEDCLNRELDEELGVKLQSLGAVMAVYQGFNKRGFKSLKIAFKANLENHSFGLGDKIETKYVSKEELLTLDMSTDEQGIKQQLDKIWSDN